jgi:uncharacterized SAM-binding protein YcdF (DUF218 family)
MFTASPPGKRWNPERHQRGGSALPPRAYVRAVSAALLFAIAAAGIFAFRGLGSWLVREDPLEHADVIVVLSGGMPSRAEEAARLFRGNYAPEVWVSRPTSPAASLAALGISYAGEETYNREILVRLGVPANCIHIFPEPIVDTEQEVREIARELREQNKKSAIIVTSPEHTRRVKALWRRIAGGDLPAILHAAPEDSFDVHWWRTTQDAFAVMRELMGLVNVWIGLPVRPHSP